MTDEPDYVSLVLLHQNQEGELVPLDSVVPVDLHRSDELTDEEVEALLDAAVQLCVPHDIDPAAAVVLAAQPVPVAFRANAWLHDHRAIVLRDWKCRIGNVRLRYQDEIGLHIEEEA